MDQPKPKERIRRQLYERWQDHKERYDQLEAELEQVAVGILTEFPGCTFNVTKADRDTLGWDYIQLMSLRKDPRIMCHTDDFRADLPFDDLPIESREAIVEAMWRKLNHQH